MWLTSLSIRRPILLLMAILAIMLGGVIAYRSMAVDLMPTVKFPFVAVTVVYPGAGPLEVETRVTKPIENAVAGAPGLKNLSSTSGDGASMIFLEFKDNIDPDAATQDVERRVNQIASTLPEDVRTPSILKFNPMDQPIIVAGIGWDRNPDGIFKLADDIVRPRLEAVEGVATVQLLGGREREIQVVVDRKRLEARGLSLSQITSALSASNLSAPSGYVKESGREYSLRVYGLAQQLDQISNLVISSGANGGIIRLKDVASVEDSFKKQTYISRVNGQEGVGILIQKQQTANTVAVSQGVHKALEELKTTLPPGVEIATVMDSATYVKDSLNGVQNSLRDAVLIVAFVLLLFLHTWRSTLIVLVSIPTSLVATFGVMWALGFSMNMMSMMGLALTIGILVDDSIVILENIHRHMKMGEDSYSAAYKGRAEIGAAAVAITLVDVVVYTPVAFLTGMVGQFFKEFGGSIVVATLFSLLVSFTLTPMLASRWLSAEGEEKSPLNFIWRRWEAGYEALARGYRRLLGRALRLRWLVILAGFLAFVAGIALVGSGLIGTEFVSEGDQGEMTLTVDLPTGTSVDVTNQEVGKLEAKLAKLPEMANFLSLVGRGGQYGQAQARSAKVYVTLKPRSQRKRTIVQVAEEIRQMGKDFPGMTVRADLASSGGGGQAIQMSVRGTDMAEISRIATQVETIMKSIPGTQDVTNSAVAGAPEMRVQLDQTKLADLGLTSAQVASALRTAYEGVVATEYRRENEDKVDIRVKYAAIPGRSELASLDDISFTSPRGTQVKLSQVAQIVPVEGPAEIQRHNRVRRIAIGSALNTRPLGDVTADINEALKAVKLPQGYYITMEGSSQLQEEGFTSLATALGISIILMFMLMAALYESLVYPLVIMGALPVATVGAFGALAITGETLNIFSMVGLIMLAGLVAKNAILLVDYTNTLRKRGLDRREALLQAGETRLRPILMTTAAMVFAMLPMTFKFAEGSETRSGMAVVVIGGLLTSTLLTLVLVPSGYTIMDDFQSWIGARFHREDSGAKLEAVSEAPKPKSKFSLRREAKSESGQVEPVRITTIE